MEALTWTGSAGTYLNPILAAAIAALGVALVAQIILGIFGGATASISAQGNTLVARRSPFDLAVLAVRSIGLLILALFVLYLVIGIVMPGLPAKGIIGAAATQFLPVWAALIATFVVCIMF